MQIANEISTLINGAQQKVRCLVAWSEREEEKLAMNGAKGAAKELEELVRIFRRCQSSYLEEINKKSSKDVDAADGSGGVSAGGFLQEVVVMEERSQVEGSNELSGILSAMESVRGLFEQTSGLVVEQGTMVDRIDFNVEKSMEWAERGKRVLQKAEDRQQHGLAKNLIVFLGLLNLIVFLMLSFKLWKYWF